MANGAWFDFRSPDRKDFDDIMMLSSLNAGYDCYVFDLDLRQAAPDVEAEIRVSYTNAFDGTASPVVLDVKSSDNTQDKAGGTGALTVGLLGISATSATGTFTYYLEIITLTGTTSVTTTRYYKRVIMAKVLTAGSGGVPVGNITVHETGGTTNTYLTIAAGAVCSVNARFYLATGYSCAWTYLYGNVIQATGTSSGNLDNGANIRPIYVDGSGVTADAYNVHTINGTLENEIIDPGFPVVSGNDTKYFTLNHVIIDTDTNMEMHYKAKIICWKAPATA